MQQALGEIVTQNLRRLIRHAGLRRVVLMAVLPFMGVVAAFGIAPDTVTDKVEVTPVVAEVAIPAVAPPASVDESYWREERIQRGDTIASLLSRLQVDDAAAVQQLRTTRGAKSLYQLVAGRVIRARVTADGRLLSLRYLNGTTLMTVERKGDAFDVQERPAQLETRVLMKSGEIRSSLFAATDAIQLSDAVAVQIANIFSTDIDFHRDLRKGDRFSVIYEVSFDGGEPVKSGRVLAAEFYNQGKTYRAAWFQNTAGEGGYYTLDGRNIRKAFLRSPLEFSRISSGFTMSRFHPVLQQWRAHKGIDYAAPIGTPVKATGDGVVDFVGKQGGYGNLVVLRHQSKFTTWYGHLSGFAKGLRKGNRVSQNELIGYVGKTGLATGPHVHYEFRINDVHHDPMRVALPPAPPITPDLKQAFDEAVRPLGLQLALLRGINYARLD